eukprot:COSAG06_NODE_15346_length_1078_cov_1.664964_2_plen_97_part_00
MLLVPLLYPPLSERALQRLLLSPLFLQARDQTLHLDREDATAGGGLPTLGWVHHPRVAHPRAWLYLLTMGASLRTTSGHPPPPVMTPFGGASGRRA